MWSTGEGNGKPLQYSCLENPMNRIKRQKDMTLKDELPRLVGAQYATGDKCRNNSRKSEMMEPKQKQHPVVDVTDDGSKVWCYKEQYCIGTWDARSMNPGKLEVVKQEMAGVNINILGISYLKWTRMGEFNSDGHSISYCGQESLRRNGVTIIVNKRVQNAVLGCHLKNDRMISVWFQGKSFHITVIQVYAPTSTAEEAEVEWFYEDLQDLPELTHRKRCPFHYRGLECKSRKYRQVLPWSNRQVWPWTTEWSRSKANRVLPEECTDHSKHPLPTPQEKTLHMNIIRWLVPKSDWLYSLQPKMEKLYSQQKQDWELTVALIMNSLWQIQT